MSVKATHALGSMALGDYGSIEFPVSRHWLLFERGKNYRPHRAGGI